MLHTRPHPHTLTRWSAIALVAIGGGCASVDGERALDPAPLKTRFAIDDAERLTGRWVWAPAEGAADEEDQAQPVILELLVTDAGNLRLRFPESDPPAPPMRATLVSGADRSYAVLRRERTWLNDMKYLPMPPDATVCTVLPLVVEDEHITLLAPPVYLAYADVGYAHAGTFTIDPAPIEAAAPNAMLFVGSADDAIVYYESRERAWFGAAGSFVPSR